MVKPVAPLLAALLAVPAAATPTLDGVIGDHAVLQRDRPIPVSGTALPGEALTLTLAGRTTQATADAAGHFQASLPALSAGGPYELAVVTKSGMTLVRDLLIGDVFLCSGQSNMEMSVQGSQDAGQRFSSADDQLRLTTIEKAFATSPRSALARPAIWAAAGPANVGPFSAACYYMVQELRRSEKIPIGAIQSAWSGSRISSWIDEANLREAGMSADVDALVLYRSDAGAGLRAATELFEAWWRKQSGDRPGAEPWRPDSNLPWQPMPRVGPFGSWGSGGLAGYQGMVWFQKEITLTAGQARQQGVLSLGVIDDADRTWINGKPVGGSSNAGLSRVYLVPLGTLAAGRNVITINDDNNWMDGGLLGPAVEMRLSFADGTQLPLAEGWRYAVGGPVKLGPPRSPWDDIRGTGTLYNTMIAPLAPISLAGVAWYQGESDVDIPGYDRRLAALMRSWRRQFGQPGLPFAIVQLPDFGPTATAPVESGWPNLREEQRKAVESDGHAALAVTIDIGDPRDLHPPQKREVGRRLARAMQALVYQRGAPSGPRVASATRGAGSSVTVHFTDVTGALEMRSAAQAIGFELCGESSGSCRYVSARAAGSDVALAGDGKPATRVRYAWAESPTVNLFDQAGLPVGPFEIAIR
jgi:sialate O-acetylesterase